jgi:putative MATE family efflux protein
LSFVHHHRENLLEGDTAPHLRRLSVPLVWGLFAMNSFGIVDALYISRLGTVSLAAFGFTMPVVMFFMGIIYGLSVGTTALLARVHGEGDFSKVQRLATDSLVLTTLIVGVSSVTGYFLIDWVFHQMGATPDIMPLVHRFMTTWYIGMIFTGYMYVCNACIRADGDTRVPAALLILTSVLNACIDPFLIYGWGPFPKMGLAGAALTLVISYTITGAAGLYFVIFEKDLIRLPLFHKATLHSWRRVLHVGVPSMLANLIGPLSQAAVTWLAALIGTAAVAALGVSTRIDALATMVFYAMGAGTSIFSGQNFGAGNYGRVREVIAAGCRYVLIWGAFAAIILWAFSNQIPLLFDSHPDVIKYTSQYLRIVPVSYGALGVMVIVNSALNAIGRPFFATTLILLRAFILYVPLAYIGQKYFGFQGILYALMITNFIVGIISHLWNKIATP